MVIFFDHNILCSNVRFFCCAGGVDYPEGWYWDPRMENWCWYFEVGLLFLFYFLSASCHQGRFWLELPEESLEDIGHGVWWATAEGDFWFGPCPWVRSRILN